MQRKIESVLAQLLSGGPLAQKAALKLARSRLTVVDQWRNTAEALRRQGELRLARDVEAFVQRLPLVVTDEARIAAGLIAAFKNRDGAGAPLDLDGVGPSHER